MVQFSKIYIFVISTILMLSEAEGNILKKPKVLKCIAKADCNEVYGEESDCINNICVCDEENGCKPKVDKPKVTVIGGDCMEDEDCNVENALCEAEKCQCHPEYLESANKRKCLNVSGGLGQSCEEDIQCLSKVEHSVCSKNGKCKCDNIHHRFKFECLPNLELGSECKLDEDCAHIKFSKCGLVNCECVDGYVIASDRKRCLSAANVTYPGCEEDSQCKNLYGHGAICAKNRCNCDELHRSVNSAECPATSRTSYAKPAFSFIAVLNIIFIVLY